MACAWDPGSVACAWDPGSVACAWNPGSVACAWDPGSVACAWDPGSVACAWTQGQWHVHGPRVSGMCMDPGSVACAWDPGSVACAWDPGVSGMCTDPGSVACAWQQDGRECHWPLSPVCQPLPPSCSLSLNLPCPPLSPSCMRACTCIHTGTFDREAFQGPYVVQVTVTDNGVELARNGSTMVTISLMDVNDNTPVFSPGEILQPDSLSFCHTLTIPHPHILTPSHPHTLTYILSALLSFRDILTNTE